MTTEEINSQIQSYKAANKKVFITSSFQTHSIPILHILSKTDANIDVLFT